MIDRELLELAAKAAEYQLDWHSHLRLNGEDVWPKVAHIDGKVWNPLTDDGDAFRLAVKLNIHIEFVAPAMSQVDRVQASPKGYGHLAEVVIYEDDPCAATRKAIVIVAAEIGKAMAPGAEK